MPNLDISAEAVEVAWGSLDEYPGTTTDPQLQVLRDMLYAAMVHKAEETEATKTQFYEKVADVACDTDLSWHCSVCAELTAAIEKKAMQGNKKAKEILAALSQVGI